MDAVSPELHTAADFYALGVTLENWIGGEDLLKIRLNLRNALVKSPDYVPDHLVETMADDGRRLSLFSNKDNGPLHKHQAEEACLLAPTGTYRTLSCSSGCWGGSAGQCQAVGAVDYEVLDASGSRGWMTQSPAYAAGEIKAKEITRDGQYRV